jgi:hypothetical protein
VPKPAKPRYRNEAGGALARLDRRALLRVRTIAVAARATPSRLARAGAGGDHRRASRVDGVDDPGVVDALQVDRCDPEL